MCAVVTEVIKRTCLTVFVRSGETESCDYVDWHVSETTSAVSAALFSLNLSTINQCSLL